MVQPNTTFCTGKVQYAKTRIGFFLWIWRYHLTQIHIGTLEFDSFHISKSYMYWIWTPLSKLPGRQVSQKKRNYMGDLFLYDWCADIQTDLNKILKSEKKHIVHGIFQHCSNLVEYHRINIQIQISNAISLLLRPCCLRGSETNIILVKSEMVSPETS